MNALIYIEPIRLYEIIILAKVSANCLTKRMMNATTSMTLENYEAQDRPGYCKSW